MVRDGLHNGGRVCHRDLKGENVLVDIESGDILLLDLGLATHYSASQPRLTTCCGSPAFHSPEIVNALNHPPGAITYYGPELDIWCLALTMLALLLQTRFPLGPTHTSRYVMQERVRDRLQELDELYPPNAPWRNAQGDHERKEWVRVRKAMADFLEIDGVKRMALFAAYDVGERVKARVMEHSLANKGRSFKTTTFIPAEVKYTLPIYLDPEALIFRNPTGESEKRILSYIKYLLRSSGILYHCLSCSSNIIQLVLPLAPSTTPPSSLELPSPIARRPRSGERDHAEPPSLFNALFSFGKKNTSRSASVPPKPAVKTTVPTGQKKGKEWATKCWIKVEFEGRQDMVGRKSRRGSRASSRVDTQIISAEPLESLNSRHDSPGELDHAAVAQTLKRLKMNGTSAPIRHHKRTVSRASSVLREPKTGHDMLSPLSRQVSPKEDSKPKRRPSQSRKTSSQTISRRMPASNVIITSTEPRAYEILRKAFGVKHIDSVVIEATPELENSQHVGIESDKAETVVEEERPRGRSKEVARSHESIKNLSAELEVKLPDRDSSVVEDGPLPTTPKVEREASRGRKGFLEGWFGKGEYHEPGGKGMRSSSLPPSMLTDNLLVTHM